MKADQKIGKFVTESDFLGSATKSKLVEGFYPKPWQNFLSLLLFIFPLTPYVAVHEDHREWGIWLGYMAVLFHIAFLLGTALGFFIGLMVWGIKNLPVDENDECDTPFVMRTTLKKREGSRGGDSPKPMVLGGESPPMFSDAPPLPEQTQDV